MTENIISIEEFQKIELKIGIIQEVSNNIKINCNNKEYITGIKLDVKKGEKIVIGFLQKKLIIPVLEGNNPIVPEKDIENGARIR